MASLFDHNGYLIEIEPKETYITSTKSSVIELTRPLSNIIVYDNTTGIFIVKKIIRLIEIYNNGNKELKNILEGRFVSMDWVEEKSIATSERVTIQLLNNGDLIDYRTGSKVIDWDYIPLIKKISLIRTLQWSNGSTPTK